MFSVPRFVHVYLLTLCAYLYSLFVVVKFVTKQSLQHQISNNVTSILYNFPIYIQRFHSGHIIF